MTQAGSPVKHPLALAMVVLIAFVGIVAALGGAGQRDGKERPRRGPRHKLNVDTWQHRLDRILLSRSQAWRQRELRELCAALSKVEFTGDSEDHLALAQILEQAQWQLGDEKAAEATARRRYGILAQRRRRNDVASTAYRDAAEYSNRGMEHAAIRHYAMVVELAPAHVQAPRADMNIGKILRRTGKFIEGERHFLAVSDRYRDSRPDISRQAHYLAGDCAWRARKPERAIEIFEDIVRRYPNTPEADDARHMVKDVGAGEEPQ